jgi:4'-phosphopantetheinyl transferase
VTGDHVDIWLIRSDVPARVLGDLATVLDEAERDRAEALISAVHRRRFIAAHGAVRLIIGDCLGVPPAQIRWRHGPHGKPEVAGTRDLTKTADLTGTPARMGTPDRTGTWADVQISLSHSGGLAMLAVTQHRRVGVDIQQFPAGDHAARMAERYYPVAEARFVTAGSPADQVSRFVALWTRKEACVKVTGGRLMQGMKLPVRAAGRRVIVRDPSGALPGPYLVRDVPVPPGFHAAVALEGAEPYRMTRHAWPDR